MNALKIFKKVDSNYNIFTWLAWIEGTAILIAVALVASVGSFVDWRKEIAFVDVKVKQMEKNVVSIFPSNRLLEKNV